MAVAGSRGSNCRRATRLDCAPRNQPLARPSLKEVQIATKQPPPPPTPSVSTAAQAVSPSPNATLKKSQSAADEFAPANAGARRKP